MPAGLGSRCYSTGFCRRSRRYSHELQLDGASRRCWEESGMALTVIAVCPVIMLRVLLRSPRSVLSIQDISRVFKTRYRDFARSSRYYHGVSASHLPVSTLADTPVSCHLNGGRGKPVLSLPLYLALRLWPRNLYCSLPLRPSTKSPLRWGSLRRYALEISLERDEAGKHVGPVERVYY